jgi:hypothetical protein
MGITQLPSAPTPTAKGSIVVGTGVGSTLLSASSTNGLPLVTDSTQTTGLKYASTGKTWTCYSVSNYGSLSGARTGNAIGTVRTKIYYLGGYYIFGSSEGVIGYSTDAKSWNYQMIFPASGEIKAIAFNGTTWVVVGDNNYCYSGTPGGTWTARTSNIFGGAITLYDVQWVSGSINLFILIGDGSGGNCLSTSPDGITWTARISPANNLMSIAVNTAQNVIVIGNNVSTASQQAYYSTNGTSYSFAPVSSVATNQNYIWYMPHVDKFAPMSGNLARRSPANVGSQWDATPYERQSRPSYIMQNNPTQQGLVRNLPIWDSVNSKYYLVDVSSNGHQPFTTLITMGSTDVYTQFSTGVYTRYGFAVEKVEIVPSLSGQYITGPATPTEICAFGYGNGIWVVASGSNSLDNTANQSINVFSTAV